jgi:predicted DNA-binding transcriptional regulator AlpA
VSEPAGSRAVATPINAYLSEREFSARFGIPPRTLQRWRLTGDGPPYVRLGPRRIAYREADAEAWAASRTFAHRAAELAQRQAAE